MVHLPEQAGSQALNAHAELIETLFRDHNRRLVRFLTARLSNPQEAQEVAQEAYVRLLQLDRPGAVSFLQAFLFKTAANLATDRLRHRRVVQQVQERDSIDLDDLMSPPPERRVAADQDLHVLRAALQELSPQCREAFLLSRLTPLGPAEVARRVGLSPRRVREFVVDAMVHCRRRLDAAHMEVEK